MLATVKKRNFYCTSGRMAETDFTLVRWTVGSHGRNIQDN